MHPTAQARTDEKTSSHLWGISISGVLLVGLNFGAFMLYRNSHDSEAFLVQLWTYLGSDIFKVITVSLIFPIVLLLFDRKFKIGESAQKNLTELFEKKRLERKTKREEAISQTIKWWNELYAVAAAISHFKASQPNHSIEDLTIKVDVLSSTGEDVVNMWSHRFPELEENDSKMFLVFMNSLIHSSHAVANAMIDPKVSPSQKEYLQNCLVVVLDGIKGIAHHRIVTVLNIMSELDDPDPRHAKDEQWRSNMETRRKFDMDFLSAWAKPIIELENKENRLLDSIKSDEGKKLQRLSTKLQDWKITHQQQSLGNFPEFQEFWETFKRIPPAERVRTQSSPCSHEYVIELATLSGFNILQTGIIRRANLS